MAENGGSDPAKEVTEASFIRLAEAHRREGLTEDAIRICREGLARFPSSLRGRIVLGQSLLDQGAVGEAVVELGRVEREAGGDPDIIALLCEVRTAGPRKRVFDPEEATTAHVPAVAPDEDAEGKGDVEPSVFTLDAGGPEASGHEVPAASQDDPLASPTLAGLYASQGDSATAEAILRRIAAGETAPTVEESPTADTGPAEYLTELTRLRRIAERLRKTR